MAQGGLLPPHPVSAGQEDGPLLPAGRRLHGRTLPDTDTDFPLGHSYSLCQSTVSWDSPTRPAELKREAESAFSPLPVRCREHVAPLSVGEARAALATDGGSVFLEDPVEVSQVLGT